MKPERAMWVVGLFLVVVLALFAVGCGSEGESATTAAGPTDTTTAATETTAGGTETTSASASTEATAAGEPVTLYVGGTFALTGAYAEDCASVLAGFEDYVKYVNENHILAPWYADRTVPANITFELLWGDDALSPDKTLLIYEDLKSKGLLLERVSGSPQAAALKDLLIADKVGATCQTAPTTAVLPPGNIFLKNPLFTDAMGAAAEWFMQNWTDTSRKPRVGYLTADAALGRNIDIPEMKAALEKMGFEFAGAQFVPLVASAAPTTQLAWLKDNKVDLALGLMVNPGSQPSIKEAVRLGMGVDQEYKITFAFGEPSHLQIMVPDLGATANGVVVAGDMCTFDADNEGAKFAALLKEKYRGADKDKYNVMYLDGIVEAMTQVEALRLASQQVAPQDLTSEDVLEKGFRQIKDFDTGGITSTNLTYGEGDVYGVDAVRLQQVQDGKIIEIGSIPIKESIVPAAK